LTAIASNRTGNPEQGISADGLFPLDAPEFAVRFKSGTKVFRHVFRRITAADWEAYYDAAISESADEGGDAESSWQEASFVLYDRTILRIEGYQTRDGRKPEELPTWPHCVPQKHRLFAVAILCETVGSIAKDTFTIGAGDTTSVSFVIVRDEGESSTSKQFFGVTHHFSLPTADHWRRFVSARSKFPALYGAVISLYDELAVFAEGYSVGGMPIASEQLRREMFVPHKIYAVAALFFFLSDCDPEPRTTKAHTIPADFLGMKTAMQRPRAEMH